MTSERFTHFALRMGLTASLLSAPVLVRAQAPAKPEAKSAGQAAGKYNPPKTAWGDPDLQGIWTGDDLHDVPFERPKELGTRAKLTPEELAKRAADVDDLLGSTEDGKRRNVGYFGHAQAGVEAAAVPQNWG